MNLYPIKLAPVPKSIIWGGDKLKKLYGKSAPFDKIAESWELTVRTDGMSVIENGEFSGMTLKEYLTQFPETSGTDCKGKEFPLLIKLIDAADDLSVQVHPDDIYAKEHETDTGKTEMWYILEADEGAEIVYGVKEGLDREALCEALMSGAYNDVLHRVKVKAGDVYFIPSGQIHALCRGTLLAEIQQNSNITYRIYDYDRTDRDGKKRELHTAKALETVKCYNDSDIGKRQFSGKSGRRCAPDAFMVIADCEYFRACTAHVPEGEEIKFTVDEKSFASLLFTSADNAVLSAGGLCTSVSAGESFFIPAGIGEVTIHGSCTVLFSEA